MRVRSLEGLRGLSDAFTRFFNAKILWCFNVRKSAKSGNIVTVTFGSICWRSSLNSTLYTCHKIIAFPCFHTASHYLVVRYNRYSVQRLESVPLRHSLESLHTLPSVASPLQPPRNLPLPFASCNRLLPACRLSTPRCTTACHKEGLNGSECCSINTVFSFSLLF